MATTSITKEFYVKDTRAFERLKQDLERKPVRKDVKKSPSLEKGREKLATFVFRWVNYRKEHQRLVEKTVFLMLFVRFAAVKIKI